MVILLDIALALSAQRTGSTLQAGCRGERTLLALYILAALIRAETDVFRVVVVGIPAEHMAPAGSSEFVSARTGNGCDAIPIINELIVILEHGADSHRGSTLPEGNCSGR